MKQTIDPRIKRLAQECTRLDSVEREKFLDRVCDGDSLLREDIETALRGEMTSEQTRVFHKVQEQALPSHYRLVEMIGRGGMAEVFLAEDARLSRKVAIKFLNSEFRKDPERMRRFLQEARAASALNHPNILIIHDIGENAGVQFIVSEFVDGETLTMRIRRGRIPLAEAVEFAIQIASALTASHKAGIVHRDVKPDNVMVRRDGSIKVLDFGLAKDTGNPVSEAGDLDANTLGHGLTSPGLILGTPQYMSPEQARGLSLDGRTDIFSLGIIIFEMVTGRPPFSGSTTADIIATILTKEPRRLEEFLDEPPISLIKIVNTALRKERSERYPTMEQLHSDLKALRNELISEPYIDRRTGDTQVRTTIQHTIRTAISQRLLHSKGLILAPILILAAIAALWYSSGGRNSTLPITTGSMKTVPVASWSSGGSEFITTASFSPDAKMVAYTSSQSGANEIWVKPSVGGDPIQITRNGSYNQYPVWSPNGEEVAFFSSRGDNRGIWKTAFTGGEQIQVVRGIGPTSRPVYWAKSGKVYYQDGAELYSVAESSGAPTQVTDLANRGTRPRMIEISPDESTVVYSTRENDLWKVKTERLGSGESVEIASVKDQIDHLAWHPDGNDIYFSVSVEGAAQIFQVGRGRNAPVQISNGNIDFFVQDVSYDGSRILYGSVTETSDLWKVDTLDASESVLANDVASEYWADISPDGKSVVFQSVKQADRPYSGSIASVPVSGGSRPTVLASAGFSPVWSGNAQWIACLRRSESGFAIWRIEPGSREAVKLAEGEILTPGYTASPYLKVGTNHLSWSPDSAMIAYSAKANGASNIWLVNVDASENRPITVNTDAKETYDGPTWSEDGSFLLFLSELRTQGPVPQTLSRVWLYNFANLDQRLLYESPERVRLLGLSGEKIVFAEKPRTTNLTSNKETSYLFVQSLKTGARSRVSVLENAYFHNIHLSRDGNTIAFVSRGDNTTALWTVPVDGGTPKKILTENDPKVMISNLAWVPDGRSIVFGRQTRTNLLSMLSK